MKEEERSCLLMAKEVAYTLKITTGHNILTYGTMQVTKSRDMLYLKTEMLFDRNY